MPDYNDLEARVAALETKYRKLAQWLDANEDMIDSLARCVDKLMGIDTEGENE